MIDKVRAIAREAGHRALEMFLNRESLQVEFKYNANDVVTRADRAVEDLIRSRVHEMFPGHTVEGEERGADDTASAGSEWRWVIDPIDGTANFISGLPLWGVSIGVEHLSETVMGAVYMPVQDQLYWAEKGRGAWLGDKPLHVSQADSLSRVLVSTGFPVDKDINPDNNLDNVSRVLPLVRDLRRLGSATVDMCYVASGILGAYWELGLHEWDVKAAWLIVEEAGGVCTTFRADRGLSILCGAPAIYAKLKDLIH